MKVRRMDEGAYDKGVYRVTVGRDGLITLPTELLDGLAVSEGGSVALDIVESAIVVTRGNLNEGS